MNLPEDISMQNPALQARAGLFGEKLFLGLRLEESENKTPYPGDDIEDKKVERNLPEPIPENPSQDTY
ncbi:MAG: hypothetical protein A2722_03550 [Candidatus Doudnabacteria bacterium RIFCSPHIGHO2_01_FULL_50_11]|uniref:Uncharacterized protein n=1 Tax=Candidatus Doudnabacteria bacterium RIFCSPHIGHO2_01_FULL_50_11 TaxID=1817828 RepID=A0A1F5PIQ0_9BACT|nr:MAG: hypothetical protein A2722_03550 [Candidatus Doudnabacteria bacterium RIFCSPHIGHO2_01_FULL_50_11]